MPKISTVKMIRYLDLILFLRIICSVESSFKITPEQFEEWKGSSICTSPLYGIPLERICSWLSHNIPVYAAYTEQSILEFAKCEENVPMKFDSENGKVTKHQNQKKVLKCYLGYVSTKCVTKGSAYNDLIVWDYSAGVCHTPEEYDYAQERIRLTPLEILSTTESSYTVTSDQFDEWECSSICTSPLYGILLHKICNWLPHTISVYAAYSEQNISGFTMCQEKVPMEFDSKNGKVTGYQRKVLKCYLSYTSTKCVTKGSAYNTLIIWDYSSGVCKTPKEYDYVKERMRFTPFEKKKIVPSYTVQLPSSSTYVPSTPKTKTKTESADQLPLSSISDSSISINKRKEDSAAEETHQPSFSSKPSSDSSLTDKENLETAKKAERGKFSSIGLFDSTEEKIESTNAETAQLPFSSAPISSFSSKSSSDSGLADEGNLETAKKAEKGEFSSIGLSGSAEEKEEPTNAETAQLPFSSAPVSRVPSTKEKGDIVPETANSPVSKTSTLQRNDSTMLAEKPLQGSPTLTKSPSIKQQCGCLTCFCAVLGWVKRLFRI